MEKKDKIWAQYQRGEIALAQQQILTLVDVCRLQLGDAKREGNQDNIAAWQVHLATCEKYLKQAENDLTFWEQTAAGLLPWDEAVAVLQEAWDADEMQGLIGYINVYRTDSPFSFERFVKAARTCGMIRGKKGKRYPDDAFAGIVRVLLPIELIVQIEGVADDRK